MRNRRVWQEITGWVIGIVFAFAVIFLLAKPDGKDWPSWVQAVGSIAAIAASGRIAQLTFQKSENQRLADAETQKREQAKRERDAVRDTERMALQLMVKAEECLARLKATWGKPNQMPVIFFTAKGEFDALIDGLRSIDGKSLDSFDKFEQCVHALGACIAISESLKHWAAVGSVPSNSWVVTEGQAEVLAKSSSRFRQLARLNAIERNHAPSAVSAYGGDVAPTVSSSHS
ncbi:MAG: hypothetical protein ACK4OE_10690 [Acidovorax sp.]|uniref:hypothetical protein n=1 Tax=Acidovorax sp. TaxID=1872122 RepID=UPI00391B5DED